MSSEEKLNIEISSCEEVEDDSFFSRSFEFNLTADVGSCDEEQALYELISVYRLADNSNFYEIAIEMLNSLGIKAFKENSRWVLALPRCR